MWLCTYGVPSPYQIWPQQIVTTMEFGVWRFGLALPRRPCEPSALAPHIAGAGAKLSGLRSSMAACRIAAAQRLPGHQRRRRGEFPVHKKEHDVAIVRWRANGHAQRADAIAAQRLPGHQRRDAVNFPSIKRSTMSRSSRWRWRQRAGHDQPPIIRFLGAAGFATGRNILCRSKSPRGEVCQRRPLNLRRSFIFALFGPLA
jgi:hypothetical protein